MIILTADLLTRATECRYDRAELFALPITAAAERFDIDTPARLARFVAQTAHESARFRRVVENLNYSAEGLASTWPGRYRGKDGKPNDLARKLHRRPRDIANHTYAHRMGNGGPETQDGWKYRGRGLIQLTGRDNYAACGTALGEDFINHPERLEEPPWAALAAAWFWDANHLNSYADTGDDTGLTRRINGGTHGMRERLSLTARALRVLGQ